MLAMQLRQERSVRFEIFFTEIVACFHEPLIIRVHTGVECGDDRIESIAEEFVSGRDQFFYVALNSRRSGNRSSPRRHHLECLLEFVFHAVTESWEALVAGCFAQRLAAVAS